MFVALLSFDNQTLTSLQEQFADSTEVFLLK